MRLIHAVLDRVPTLTIAALLIFQLQRYYYPVLRPQMFPTLRHGMLHLGEERLHAAESGAYG